MLCVAFGGTGTAGIYNHTEENPYSKKKHFVLWPKQYDNIIGENGSKSIKESW